ncbi:MAG: apolipoprotein N-acyltransferase [Betaproteobacteria bacterium]
MTFQGKPAVSLPSGFLLQLCLALAAGAVGVLAFAPLYFWPLAPVSLWVLFSLWYRSATTWRAFALGFAWGLGLFTAGVSWIYVSLHVYGNMPALLAGVATLLFCAYLALYPALAGALTRTLVVRLGLSATSALLVVMPASFVAFEYLRGWVVSGFPWLSIGYSQTPGGMIPAPLTGYAAITGVYGISWLLAIAVALVVRLTCGAAAPPLPKAQRIAMIALLVLIAAGGSALQQIVWSDPSGKPLSVALLQGNIEQDLKWRDDQRTPTLANYHQLITASQAKLIVLPETALPDLLDRIPGEFLESIRGHARKGGADILLGVPIADQVGGATPHFRYANSAISMGASTPQRYDKQHLVAFGEFVPPLFAWVYRWLQIPLADFNSRAVDSRPMHIAGHRIAINICYEDTFGREIALQLPEAELLVNISNMAWFGASLAPDQHAQMSQMRALESARWMLRATNTGATAAIDEKGVIVRAMPAFTRGTLEVTAQPLTGATPYSRWRDTPVLVCLAISLLSAALLRRRTSPAGR